MKNFQCPPRESKPRPSGLKHNALLNCTKRATSCFQWLIKKKAKVLIRTDYPHRASLASRIDRHAELKELATPSRYVSRGRQRRDHSRVFYQILIQTAKVVESKVEVDWAQHSLRIREVSASNVAGIGYPKYGRVWRPTAHAITIRSASLSATLNREQSMSICCGSTNKVRVPQHTHVSPITSSDIINKRQFVLRNRHMTENKKSPHTAILES